MTRLAWSVATAAAAVLGVGCTSPSPGPSCTLIGAVSGVNFDFLQVTPSTGTFVIHACVRTKCADETISRDTTHQLLVTDDSLDSAGPVAVALVIRTSTHKLVFRAAGQVTLARLQPNGPKCPPVAWYRNILATTTGELTPA